MLVLRVWPEENGLRGRMIADGQVMAAQGVDAICAEIRRWLTGQE